MGCDIHVLCERGRRVKGGVGHAERREHLASEQRLVRQRRRRRLVAAGGVGERPAEESDAEVAVCRRGDANALTR